MNVTKYLHEQDHRYDIFSVTSAHGDHVGTAVVNRPTHVFLACDVSSTIMNSNSRNLEIVAMMAYNSSTSLYELVHSVPMVVSNAVTKAQFMIVIANELAASTNDTNFEETFLPLEAVYTGGSEDYNRFHIFFEQSGIE